MELQQLHHFLVIARTGSVARAADELNLTQSGLSRSLKTLEDSVGLPLFRREARGMALTAYGEALLGRATLIWNERSRAVAELRDLKAARAGRIEVGLHSVFNYAFGNEVLGAFAERHPLVNVSVWSGADPELTQRLVAGELEFAFTLHQPGAREPDLVFEQLAELECSVVVRPVHPLAGRSEVAPREVIDAPWALCDATGGLREFEALFYAWGQDLPGRLMETTSIALLMSAMLTRDLITILPTFLVQSDALKGRLVSLKLPKNPPPVRAGLLYRREMARTAATQALSEIFRAQAGQLAVG